jgi:hypothetical protein
MVVAALLCGITQCPWAQTLPPPTRDVYRCELGGHVTYSETPCLGAKRVDVTPTRGLNKSSGVERTGPDVRAERLQEDMATALKPIFGETAAQRAQRHRRAKLHASARQRCQQLDNALPATEAAAARAGQADEATHHRRLLALRLEYKNLSC